MKDPDQIYSPRLILHAPVYFHPGQSAGDSCHAEYRLPGDGSNHLLPHAHVGMCCLCGRRGVAVEPGSEDAYLTGKYSHVILDGHTHQSVRDVEDALRALAENPR